MSHVCLACGGTGGDTEFFSGPGVSCWVPCDWCGGSGLVDREWPEEDDPDAFEEPPYRDEYEEFRLEQEGQL